MFFRKPFSAPNVYPVRLNRFGKDASAAGDGMLSIFIKRVA
jgi:hypothetical protein